MDQSAYRTTELRLLVITPIYGDLVVITEFTERHVAASTKSRKLLQVTSPVLLKKVTNLALAARFWLITSLTFVDENSTFLVFLHEFYSTCPWYCLTSSCFVGSGFFFAGTEYRATVQCTVHSFRRCVRVSKKRKHKCTAKRMFLRANSVKPKYSTASILVVLRVVDQNNLNGPLHTCHGFSNTEAFVSLLNIGVSGTGHDY